jgi:FXSXX-COOH protein
MPRVYDHPVITDARPAVSPSALPDLSGVPLADLDAAILDEAVRRVIPESPEMVDTPFNSAI